MEGKKIAFIVVAIATVGGIGYYLYKKNKEVVVTPPASPFSAEAKAQASAKALDAKKNIAKYTQARTVASQNYVKASNNYE
jgi:hypothetical protein